MESSKRSDDKEGKDKNYWMIWDERQYYWYKEKYEARKSQSQLRI